MGKNIYSVKNEKSAEFPLYDGSAWYKEVSDIEFSQLRENRMIQFSKGRFFATASSDEARTAAERLGPAPAGLSYKSSIKIIPKLVDDGGGGGLYSNPGKILKGIATVIFVIGVIATLMLAIRFGYTTTYWGYSELDFGLFAGILIGGVVISYLSGLGLAAFGDLVLSANEINRKLK